MAQQVITTFVDDLDGSEADGTVRFGLDGRTYEIDLNESNAVKLREQFAPYIEAGRKAGKAPVAAAAPAGRKPRTDREQTAAIREWARNRGHQVNDLGRIPKAIVDAYHSEN